MSPWVAQFQIFRRLMKAKFYAYVLLPLAKKFQNWIVDQSTARDFLVPEIDTQVQNDHGVLGRLFSSTDLRHRTGLMSTPWSLWTSIFTLGFWKMMMKKVASWNNFENDLIKSLGLLCQASWLNPKHCTKLYSDNISLVTIFKT